MKVLKLEISNYRSINHVEIAFPENKPLVLFGSNNAGKSNIISALNRILGERFAPYLEMSDSDFFMRDAEQYPNALIACEFDSPYHFPRYGNPVNKIAVKYDKDSSLSCYMTNDGNKAFVSNDERKAIQSFLVDADRSINYQFGYSNRYTLLSKFSHAIHEALNSNQKENLNEAFETIKEVFQTVPEYASFMDDFISSVSNSVQGFAHKLEVDFSAYDPNNYTNAMRVFAKEGDDVRSFNEFGTGEQQILLMTFAKAYMQAFGSEAIVLILEEPEAHLHPLAQAWLKEYIYKLCESGLQIVISTHSPDFIDPGNLEGLVRVYKTSEGVTKITQCSKTELVAQCIQMGVPQQAINNIGVSNFYKAKLSTDMLKGLFARRILLVEGRTERLALPVYIERSGFSLPAHGVEIVDCGGKTNIPSLYRFFSAYEIECYCLFDGDESKCSNRELESLLGINSLTLGTSHFFAETRYAYFSKDYETTIRSQISSYQTLEDEAKSIFKAKGKPAIARISAIRSEEVPSFVSELISRLEESFGSVCSGHYDDHSPVDESWDSEDLAEGFPF